MKVEQLINDRGNAVANQFVITGGGSITFQSYKTKIAVLQNIYDDIDGLIDDNKLYILGDVINLLDCAEIKVKKEKPEHIGVKESPYLGVTTYKCLIYKV